MPYTRAWDETAPLGSADAGTIDNIIRELKADIRERMNTILLAGAKWDQSGEPDIELDLGAIGGQTGITLYFGPTAFTSINDEDNTTWTDLYFQMENNTNATCTMPVQLPVGARIRTVETITDKNGASSFTLDFRYRVHSISPSSASVGQAAPSASGVRADTLFSGDHLITADRSYYLSMNNPFGGQPRFYSLKVVLDVDGLDGYIG
jgi:hypothetical protein